MVELSPGTIVRVVPPNVTVQYSAPGIVQSIWLKEGPPGPAGSGVSSVNGDTGPTVTLVASEIPFTPTGSVAATDVQAAIAEVNSEKQPLDSDLTTIAGLTATTGNFMMAASSAWASRTPSQARAAAELAASTLGGAEKKAAASATTGSTTLDCSAASVFSVTPTGNITAVSLTNVPASGTACTITFIVNQGATPRTIATPSGGVFLGTATPTQVANKTCVFTYLTVDGGTTWYCSAAVQV